MAAATEEAAAAARVVAARAAAVEAAGATVRRASAVEVRADAAALRAAGAVQVSRFLDAQVGVKADVLVEKDSGDGGEGRSCFGDPYQ